MSDISEESSNLMPSVCNNTSIINNQINTEQPKTKRQRIEKINSITKNFKNDNKATSITILEQNGLKATTNKKTTLPPPPPDLIESGEIITVSNKRNNESSNHICSSLSSSAHSISSTPSSLNNSPTSTPCTSRATSLTQLLNVQSNLANNLPSTSNTANVTSNSISNTLIHNENKQSPSTDEVDRINMLLPDLLPQNILEKVAKIKNTTKSQTTSNSIDADAAVQDMRQFELSLTRQCLCGVSEDSLQKPFQSHYSLDANGQKRIANLNEWPTNKLLQFLSNLQLLFEIYLKQNAKGFICARIMDLCDALIRNDRNLINEIIVLAGYNNPYVRFLAERVLASFLVIAKQELDDSWLEKLVDNLFFLEHLNRTTFQKIHFSLEIIKRIVNWNDKDPHPLEDEIVNRDNTNVTHMHAGNVGNLMEPHHAYAHFRTQQPTLENNYFAAHFQAMDNSSSDDEHISNGGHEVQFLENEHSPINMMALQEQYDHFRNELNMPHNSSVPTNFAVDNADIGAMHLSSPYGSPAQSDPITSVFASTNHNTSTSYNENILVPHFAINAADLHNTPMRALINSGDCNIVTLTDSESFDTKTLKCTTIKILENKWPALVQNMSNIIANHLNIENAENCVLNFLQLWGNIISVQANFSVVETLPFYAQLDNFETLLLYRNLPCTVYKQMLFLFNEALDYGNTLALQDMPPPETCILAKKIVRHVKDLRILESLPRHQPENIVGLIGFKRAPILYDDYKLQAKHCNNNVSTVGNEGTTIKIDKIILQKLVLLVLKSIAVAVKEIRSDSSDSSIDSTDYDDAFQEMVVIERSIRDVLRKLETFIKGACDFHPECHFSKILIHLFGDQDDHLIEAMVCTLDVTTGISFRNNAFPQLVAMLNPVYTFLEFLKMVSNSSDLLLDLSKSSDLLVALLDSSETCFLLYLLRFLKYIRANWSMFVQSCDEFGMGTNALDAAMDVLKNLRLKIVDLVMRKQFEYDISPILRLLENCESLYEIGL